MNSGDDYAPAAGWIDRWWDPQALLEDMLARKDKIPGHVPGNLFFNDPALKPLREAYAAAKFAKIRGQGAPCQVRLIDPAQQFPDFEILFGKVIEQFEIVEADRAERQRGDEYREADNRAASGAPPVIEHYDPDEEMAAAIPAIAAVLERKAKKYYQPQPHLLVYVNFPTDNGKPPLKDLHAIQLGERFQTSFPSIWFLWGDNAIRCWPNPANIPLRSKA